MPHHRSRHDPDGSGPGDGHVFTDEWPLEGGVDRIAERVEEHAQLRVDVRRVHPGIHRRDDDVVRKGTVAVHTDPDGVDAEVSAPRPAVAAHATHQVSFPGHLVADGDVGDISPHLGDLTEELMAQSLRHLHGAGRPLVVVVEVQVGAAQPRPQHTDLDVLVTTDGLRDVDEFQARSRGQLSERSHGSHLCVCRALSTAVGCRPADIRSALRNRSARDTRRPST